MNIDNINSVHKPGSKIGGITEPAAPEQNGRRGYVKHGDITRQHQAKEKRLRAINGRTLAGRQAKAWRRYALSTKGGKACPIGTREKIDAGTFYLWRALELRFYIVADARKRGTPLNKRYGKLPLVNEQYDACMGQWQRINDEPSLPM